MADQNAVELIKRSDARFAKRQQLDSFRQEVALNFAPHLAEWTSPLMMGDDYASHVVDGTPLLLARDFVGQIGAMLRPPGKQYFWHRTYVDKLNNSREVRDYLDWRSGQMMRIIHDRVTGYSRATKQADEFFGLFGDAVLSVDLSPRQDSLRIRNWHTKDCTWAMGDDNRANVITRKEWPTARIMRARFGEKKLHEKVNEAFEKDPDLTFEVRHEVLPVDEYEAYCKRTMKNKDGWVSVWVDVAHKTVLREAHWEQFRYVVPRWVSLSGWAYAISPATTIALPDARMIQQQALAILEASEKSVNPPLVAYSDTIRGDVRLDAGGITWVDKQYDSRTGQPIEPLDLGKNFPMGVDIMARTEAQLARAFYIDVLRMPDTRSSKSTVEVKFLIDEYIRAALPLFAPMQVEYNDELLYVADQLIEQAGGYDREKPKALKGEPLTFQWDNPLSEMLERQKSQMVSELGMLAQTVAALEAAAQQARAIKQVDTVKMFRESAMGLGTAGWLLDEFESEDAMAAQDEATGMQQAIGAAPNIAALIDSGVNAAKASAEIPNPSEPGVPLLPMPM